MEGKGEGRERKGEGRREYGREGGKRREGSVKRVKPRARKVASPPESVVLIQTINHLSTRVLNLTVVLIC